MPDSETAKENNPHHFDRWVDYLPSNNNGNELSSQVVKRVSLDATETWNSDDEIILEWPSEVSPAIMITTMEDEEVQHETGSVLMDPPLLGVTSSPTHSDDGESHSSQHSVSLQDLFDQRRAHLAASIQRSNETRKCLEPHIAQRASLAHVLADVALSATQVSLFLRAYDDDETIGQEEQV